MRTARQGADALREALRTDGVSGLLSDSLAEPTPTPVDQTSADQTPALDRPGPAQLAITGPRTQGREDQYEVLLEMILEGYRLHYGQPLVVRPDDADLALLLGDQLYALGLARLAELGDLDAVAELADVISLAAQAHSASDRELAEAAWEAGAVSVGWGMGEDHRRAKDRARAHEPGAAEALRATAAARRGQPL
jgi:hypothetical protein